MLPTYFPIENQSHVTSLKIQEELRKEMVMCNQIRLIKGLCCQQISLLCQFVLSFESQCYLEYILIIGAQVDENSDTRSIAAVQ